MGMIDNELRKRVIKGLETCEISGTRKDCEGYGCPYFIYNDEVSDDCQMTLFSDALALLKVQKPEAMDAPKPDSDIGCWYDITHNYTLEQVVSALKAQEPRLITMKDFENNPNVDHNGCLPAWIEYRRDEDWGEYWENQPDEWGICRKDSNVYESMRYWTSRPTDEQRKETKWG